MKTIKKGITQTIALDQSGLANNLTVKLFIVGDDGNFITDSVSAEIKDRTLTYNTTTQKYQIDLIIKSTTENGYIRCYFSCDTVTLDSIYYPEDAKLVDSSISTFKPEVVPVQYFIDYFLSIKNRLDPELEDVVTEMIKDREGLRSMLDSSEMELETDLEMYISERTVIEKRDNDFERFTMNMWQMQAAYVPINELVQIKIIYGTIEIAELGVSLFSYDRIMGLIEFIPIPTGESAGLYTLLLTNLSAMGLAVVRGGLLDRIPNMFQFTYKTGLFYSETDAKEKELLRRAICRRCMIDIKKYIDPKSERASESESIDGVSASIGNKSMELLKELRNDEKEFIQKMQKRYAKGIDAVVV